MAGAIDIRDPQGKPTGRQQMTSFADANLSAAELAGFDLKKCRISGARME
jgi:uncharacterized protein YjbI with pentapeptide repeats